MLINGLDIRIIHANTGQIIRELTLNPDIDYQAEASARPHQSRVRGSRRPVCLATSQRCARGDLNRAQPALAMPDSASLSVRWPLFDSRFIQLERGRCHKLWHRLDLESVFDEPLVERARSYPLGLHRSRWRPFRSHQHWGRSICDSRSSGAFDRA
jgi:hypothetical protein